MAMKGEREQEKRAGAERKRLAEDAERKANWKRWGPYLSERQWGTVREDYSPDGEAWTYFPHDHARSRAYRWGEDGLLGFTDRECRLCFAIGLWNGKDPILKERLFGLSNPEGNHGEDCKELYYYLDSTPTYSYCKALYKYPQAEFPYAQLRDESRRRGFGDPEFEILDTGVFDENRYFDVMVEYAKAGPDDVLIRVTITNRGPDAADLHVLPTLWFRNTWIWGCEHEGCTLKPRIAKRASNTIEAEHETLGVFRLSASNGPDEGAPDFLFTGNESNSKLLWGVVGYTPYVKDAFHEAVVRDRREAVNPKQVGTKAAAHYRLNLSPGATETLRLRLNAASGKESNAFGQGFDRVFKERIQEADDFYSVLLPESVGEEERRVQRQAYAGLLWSKQFYHYSVHDWLHGDRDIMAPPDSRREVRNAAWTHLFNRDLISMPDKWEYPWYAAWDLAFHMIPFAKLDPGFAKEQLVLMLREWYMHPNGQMPAYEWEFSDVNPPVHAWACWRVYKMTGRTGKRDIAFLARTFHKLLINFTWWVNRKDPHGKNVFSGGFLGLDNIGVFDRSKALPSGGHLEQADGTAWMAFYCSTMLAMALELAMHDRSYADVASKFFEHFVAIADAINRFGGSGLWNEEDGFYYDQLHANGTYTPLKVRSMVGLVPLLAVDVLHHEQIAALPGFKKRMDWFLTHRKDLAKRISWMTDCPRGSNHQLLAIPTREQLERVLRYVFDEGEFLSPFGLRSLSKHHEQNPYTLRLGNDEYGVRYLPGESDSGLFGGNSNWRGPIWMPLNYLLIEALERYHHFFGDSLTVELPTGSGRHVNLKEAADELAGRLVRIFLPNREGQRPCHGGERKYANDPHFKNLVLFNEYFHGDTGRGLGASHQTGWTALVAKIVEDLGRRAAPAQPQEC
jgi:hypothetical protein